MRVRVWRTGATVALLFTIPMFALPRTAAASPATATGAAEPQKYAGRPVADVLQELQTAEMRIIFSTALVQATLRVKAEPKGSDAAAIARQILEPHGLTVRPGPRGTLIVVAAPRVRAVVSKPVPQKAPARSVASGDDSKTEASAETMMRLPVRMDERVDVTTQFNDTAAGSGASYTVDSRTIREAAGGMENVFQVFPLLPGAAATNDKDGKLAVRGAGPEHNLVVLDGVQIHDPHRFGDYPTMFLNPATASSVTLDASGVEADYGGRLSSVVSLETRDGRADRQLAVSGSMGMTNGDVLFEGRLPGTETGSWWTTARGTYYRLVANRFNAGIVPSFGDLQSKVTLNPSARTRVSIFALVGRESMLTYDAARATGGVTVGTRVETDHRIAAGTLRWTPGPRLAAITTVSAYSTASREQDNQLPAINLPFDRYVDLLDVAARHRLVYEMPGGHFLSAGAEVHRVSSAWQMNGYKRPEFWRGIGPSTWGEMITYAHGPIDSRLRRTQAGGWVQDRVRLGSHLTFEPGVRVDWNSFTGETAWQPRLHVTTVVRGTSIWGGLSTQVQTPSHEALQGFEYFDLDGDRSTTLRNERSRQLIVGAERPLGRGFSLRTEAYRRTFDHLLVQRLETLAERSERLVAYVIPFDLPRDSAVLEFRPTIHPESTGTGDANGVEVLLQRAGARTAGWFGYTLSRATRELYGHTVPFDFDRRHALSAALMVRLTSRVRLSASWQAASGFPVTPLTKDVTFTPRYLPDGTPVGPLRPVRQVDGSFYLIPNEQMRRLSTVNTQRLRGYERTDLRVTYSTGGRWEFYGEVINLFDSRNYVQKVQGDGFESLNNVYATYPRFPTGGLRVTF